MLVLDQPVDELRARIFLLLGRGCRVNREQHPRLDVNERRGHENKFARHVNIQLLEHPQVVEVLFGDLGDGDVVDVDFLLADEVKEEVERPFVDFELHGRRRCGHVRGALRPRGGVGRSSRFEIGRCVVQFRHANSSRLSGRCSSRL